MKINGGSNMENMITGTRVQGYMLSRDEARALYKNGKIGGATGYQVLDIEPEKVAEILKAPHFKNTGLLFCWLQSNYPYLFHGWCGPCLEINIEYLKMIAWYHDPRSGTVSTTCRECGNFIIKL